MQKDLNHIAKHVFAVEAKALTQLSQQLSQDFTKVILLLQKCKGRIVLCGMGKSGLIAKKITATLASTGSPSFFLHPSEAIHGDLGMLKPDDCFISLSNSGETDEILQLIPHIQTLKIPHITLVGNPNSTLGQHADFILNVGITEEASPIPAVPMASTTATLAMGDAIAAALISQKKFTETDFAQFHPGGSLGRKLLTSVAQLMRTENLPVATSKTNIKDLLLKMSKGRLGHIVILDSNGFVEGIVSDGDLRRGLNTLDSNNFFHSTATELMTEKPKTVKATLKVWEAEELMNEYNITALPVVTNGKLVGILSKHDIR
jgi:arabinose-5-phosphate isomerase